MRIKLDKAYSGEKIIEAVCNLCVALEAFFPDTKWTCEKSSHAKSTTVQAKPFEIKKINRTAVYLSVKVRRRGLIGACLRTFGFEWREPFFSSCIDLLYIYPNKTYKKIDLLLFRIERLLNHCGLNEFQYPFQTFIEFLAPALLDNLRES